MYASESNRRSQSAIMLPYHLANVHAVPHESWKRDEGNGVTPYCKAGNGRPMLADSPFHFAQFL